MQILLIALVGSATLAGVISGIAYARIPDRQQSISACMDREQGLPPVQRMDVCLCITDSVTTFSWLLRRMFASSEMQRSEQALRNQCFASVYEATPHR